MPANQEIIPVSQAKHIGVVVKDLEKVLDLCTKAFGWELSKRWEFEVKAYVHGKMSSYRGRRARVKVGSIYLELGETLGESVLVDFLKLTGGGLHHLAFTVEDVDKEMAKLDKLGFSVIQSVFKKDGSRENVYITAPELGNIVIELECPQPEW